MDKSLLLFATLGFGAWYFNQKKTPTTSKPKDQPKEDPKPQEDKPTKEYLSLFPSRKVIIDQEMFSLPTAFTIGEKIPALGSSLSYQLWFVNNPKGLYQDWLTTMLYIQIALLEKRWDAYTGELPLLLEPNKRLDIIKLEEPPIYGPIVFLETPAECDARLLQGHVLWSDINAYIKDNLNACPQGAFCG